MKSRTACNSGKESNNRNANNKDGEDGSRKKTEVKNLTTLSL